MARRQSGKPFLPETCSACPERAISWAVNKDGQKAYCRKHLDEWTERQRSKGTEVVVPKVSIVGSAEYIAAGISNARGYAQFVERDARPLTRFCRELRACKAWETWLPDEPKTWERFCLETLGYDAAFIDGVEKAIAALDKAQPQVQDGGSVRKPE